MVKYYYCMYLVCRGGVINRWCVGDVLGAGGWWDAIGKEGRRDACECGRSWCRLGRTGRVQWCV